MQDIYEAIEKLTMVLSLRIDNAVRKRGWAAKPEISRLEVTGPTRKLYPLCIGLPMPLGQQVSFLPEEKPSEDQSSWAISIQRSDGVNRQIWSDGIKIRKVDNGYQLFIRNEIMDETLFKRLIDELSSAGLSGHALTICKAYTSRFGTVSPAVYEVLFSAQHVEQLEAMHEAVLTGISQIEVERELNNLLKWPPTEE
jgi:hypothetical protein